MAQFRPDIKPPMWGPPDQVQYAVRANAERMGCPVPQLYVVAWESAGKKVNNYGCATQDADIVGDSIKFETNRIRSDKNDSSRIDLGTIDGANPISGYQSQEITCIFRCNAFRNLAFMRVFDKSDGASGSNGWAVWWRSGATWDFVVNGTQCLGTLTQNVGEWQTVAYSCRSGNQYHRVGDSAMTNSATFTFVDTATPAQMLAMSNNNRQIDGLLDYTVIYDKQLNAKQVDYWYYAPYALLMPVARPVYFDLGGEPPGPVPYSLTQDMLAGVSSAWVMTQDGLASVSESIAATQDGISPVSSSHAATQDGTASVSTSWLIIQDGDAAVSEITGYYVTMDAVAAISEEVATTQDGSGGVSSTYALEQDGTGQVSSSYMTVQDAQAQVSEGIIYTVTMDAIAQVSEVITIRQDAVVGIATSYEQLQDIAAGISSGYAIVQDGRAHVIEVDFAQMARVLKVSSGMTAISIKSVGKVRQAFKSASKLTIIQI